MDSKGKENTTAKLIPTPSSTHLYEYTSLAVANVEATPSDETAVNTETTPSDEIAAVVNKRNYENVKIACSIIISVINGALYFFMAAAGSENLEKLTQLEGNSDANIATYCLGVGASIGYTMFVYKTLESLTLRAKSCLSIVLSILAPFAASAFLTGGIEGAMLVNIGSGFAIVIGILLFLLRTVTMVDGAVKFQDRITEIRCSWTTAFAERNVIEILRLAFTVYTAIGYSTATTDAVYAAIIKLASWLGTSDSLGLQVTAYVSSAIGAIAFLPTILYWTHRGIKQMTYGGRADASGVNRDPTDRYTAIGAVAAIPVVLGLLGGATAANGMAFAKAGTFATVVRVSTSVIYAFGGAVPGLSTLFRGMTSCSQQSGLTSCRASLFNASCCREKAQTADKSSPSYQKMPQLSS